MNRRERFLNAALSRPVDRPPVWLMRQAGRYLPSYQEIRKTASFFDICNRPDLAVEVALQPVDQFGMDAAIIFNDILIPLMALGLEVVFEDTGPQVSPAVQSDAALDRLHAARFSSDEPVARALVELRRRTADEVACLGFAGAPFTLALYAIEGRAKPEFVHLKRALFDHPARLHRLLALIAPTVVEYLCAQVAGGTGAHAVQLFDSWAGILDPAAFAEFALPYLKQVVREFKRRHPAVPVILFGRGLWPHIEALAAIGIDVLSLDWTQSLATAASRLTAIGSNLALQGNLDPTVLTAGPAAAHARTAALLREVPPALARSGGLPPRGWIVNLGHGILPQTQVESVRAMVSAVQAMAPASVERLAAATGSGA
ncbi:MAG: uroporphyrinogen decarboxylase [Planctomycetota bacterium]